MGAQAVSTGLSDAQLESALDAFRAVVGAEHVLTGEDAAEFRDPFWFAGVGRVRRRGGRPAGDRRGDPGDRADRQRAPRADLDDVPGAQQRLRRQLASRPGLDRDEPAPDEPGPRDQRGARLCRRRAGRAVDGPVRGDHRAGFPADALDPGSRLGQRHRQRARPRHHLHALRRGLPDALRHGGRDRRRRAAADRHGRDAGQPEPGTCTGGASGRRSTSCSCSPTSASWSRRACG